MCSVTWEPHACNQWHECQLGTTALKSAPNSVTAWQLLSELIFFSVAVGEKNWNTRKKKCPRFSWHSSSQDGKGARYLKEPRQHVEMCLWTLVTAWWRETAGTCKLITLRWVSGSVSPVSFWWIWKLLQACIYSSTVFTWYNITLYVTAVCLSCVPHLKWYRNEMVDIIANL